MHKQRHEHFIIIISSCVRKLLKDLETKVCIPYELINDVILLNDFC